MPPPRRLRSHAPPPPRGKYLMFLVVTLLCWVPSTTGAFVSVMRIPPTRYTIQSTKALPTPEESAQALSNYMAKAHEEKLKAVAAEAAKYKAIIKELETKLAECENRKSPESGIVATTAQPELPTTTALSVQNPPSADNREVKSYEFPATNKALAERISAYQKFISEYIVQAQIEKTKAVADAEQKTRLHYEALLEKAKQQ